MLLYWPQFTCPDIGAIQFYTFSYDSHYPSSLACRTRLRIVGKRRRKKTDCGAWSQASTRWRTPWIDCIKYCLRDANPWRRHKHQQGSLRWSLSSKIYVQSCNEPVQRKSLIPADSKSCLDHMHTTRLRFTAGRTKSTKNSLKTTESKHPEDHPFDVNGRTLLTEQAVHLEKALCNVSDKPW